MTGNVIPFPTRFTASDRDRIIVSRWLRAGEDGGQQVAHAVHHVDARGKPIARLWDGVSYREAMANAEAASAERGAIIEIDIRAVRQ